MTINYIPNFIHSNENMKSGDKITAEKWNAVHNLLVTQGDKNSETIAEIIALLNGLTLSPMEIKPLVPSVYDDEFDGTALDPKWSWVNCENGAYKPPTEIGTEEEAAAYCSDTAPGGLSELAAPLVEQYAAQYGQAIFLAWTHQLIGGRIFVTDGLIYFSDWGAPNRLRCQATACSVLKAVTISYNPTTLEFDVGPLEDIPMSSLDDYGVGSVDPGILKLIQAVPYTQFQAPSGSTGEIFRFVGGRPIAERNILFQNSHLVLETKVKSAYYYDEGVSFLTQPLPALTFPISVGAALQIRVDRDGDNAAAGIVLRNRVSGEYLIYGILIDAYADTTMVLVRGNGETCTSYDAVDLPNHTWGIDFTNIPKIYPRFVLTETGVDLYQDLFGDWFKCDSFTYEELFPGFQASDLANFDIGLAFLRNGADPIVQRRYTCEYIGVDWFRVGTV